jgi:hypothetical protein
MGSGVRALLLDERYTGLIIWNKSEWTKDRPPAANLSERMSFR